MPKIFTHITFFFFFLTALSGVWMRLFAFNVNLAIPYDNILHSHSHLAILGWTFLGVFIIFLMLFWNKFNKRDKSEAKRLTFTLFIVTTIMFLTFLYQGYGVYSIIMSTLHIFLEYWMVSFIYRITKRNMMPKISKFFINAALIALVISTIGPFSLGYISATGLKDSYLFDVVIYFYLHFQYNGWLFLILIGLFTIILSKRKISIQQPVLIMGFWIYIIALLPSFFASVLWVEHGNLIYILALIGTVGQWLAVLCILYSFKNVIKSLKHQVSKYITLLLSFTFLLLFFKSTMELGLIIPNLAELIFETRSVVIGYLHFTLLGFISVFILIQYLLTHVIPENNFTIPGLTVFLIGFLLNEILLYTQGLFVWLQWGSLPYYTVGLLIASILLLLSITLLWVSYLEKPAASS